MPTYQPFPIVASRSQHTFGNALASAVGNLRGTVAELEHALDTAGVFDFRDRQKVVARIGDAMGYLGQAETLAALVDPEELYAHDLQALDLLVPQTKGILERAERWIAAPVR